MVKTQSSYVPPPEQRNSIKSEAYRGKKIDMTPFVINAVPEESVRRRYWDNYNKDLIESIGDLKAY